MTWLVIPPGVDWELLVVNNNCTDATDDVIASFSPRLPVRRVFEPNPGQSNARNAAVREARGAYILWTDDDVLVDPNWVAEYVAAASQHPGAAFFGGPIDPWFEVEPPKWIMENLQTMKSTFALLQHGGEVRPLAASEFVNGANMAIRRELVESMSFDPRFGLRGMDHIRGDDSELIGRLKKAGYLGIWVGSAKVRHYIPATRLTRTYVWHWHYGSGQTLVRFNGTQGHKSVWGVPRWAVRQYLESSLKAWALFPFKGERWLRAFTNAARALGVIQEAWAMLPEKTTKPQG